MEDDKNKKYLEMTTEPVARLVTRSAIPAIITMLIFSIYNIVDTMYVGRISTEATAGVGIASNYAYLIQAIAFFFAQGSGNYISTMIGAKEHKKASEIASVGFFSCLIVGVVLMVLGYVFCDSILRFLGSSETILPDARSYMKVLIFATPFSMATFVLNVQMRLLGNAKIGMIGMVTGAFINILLDPILIFGLDMGVSGAALATLISQLISFIILYRIHPNNGGVKVEYKNFKPSVTMYNEITAGGLPSLLRQSLGSVASICLFQLAGNYGDSAIAGISVMSRVYWFATSIVTGFGQGFQPVCGFNYGAKKYERVKDAFWFSVKVVTIYCCIFSIIGFIFAPEIISIFRAEDKELVRVGAMGLRLQAVVYPLLGYTIMVQMFLQNIRKKVSASILSMGRQGIFYLPLLPVLSFVFGLKGLLLTQPIADILTFGLSIYFGSRVLKDMMKEDL